MKKNEYLHIIISFVLATCILLILKPENGLTQTGINLIAVFVSVMYLWVSIGVTWTSIVAIPLLVLSGCMNISSAISSGLGNQMCFFLIMSGMINIALTRTGCIERFITWFISRKIVNGRPYMFIFLFSLSTYLLSLVMAGVTVCVIELPIIKGICDELGYKEENRFAKTLYMLANWISLLGYVATPIGHSTTLLCLNALTSFGYEISFTDWIKVGIPISFLWFVIILITVRLFYRVDTEQYSHYDVSEVREKLKDMGPLTVQGKITVTVFLSCVLLFLVPDLLENVFPAFASVMKSLDSCGIMAIGVIILSVIHIDNESILNFNQSITQINWNPIFMCMGVYPISSALVMEETGITAWITNNLKPFATGINSWIVFVILVAAAMVVITQFMGCGTIMVIGIMVSAPIAISLGFNPVAIAMICCFTANMGLMTPSASGGAGIVLGSGYLTPKDGMTLGWFVIPQSIFIGILSYILISNVLAL